MPRVSPACRAAIVPGLCTGHPRLCYRKTGLSGRGLDPPISRPAGDGSESILASFCATRALAPGSGPARSAEPPARLALQLYPAPMLDNPCLGVGFGRKRADL